MSEREELSLRDASVYERIYAIAGQIPCGRLASYGQIAAIEGHCTPRMVGYAMAAVGTRQVPWQRVINSRGTVSERRHGGGTSRQRRLLESEGVAFDGRGRVDFNLFGWAGPDWEWIDRNGFYAAPSLGNAGRAQPSRTEPG
jgi:methylated-DNA-protein-cysteine methyltransferase-like protein